MLHAPSRILKGFPAPYHDFLAAVEPNQATHNRTFHSLSGSDNKSNERERLDLKRFSWSTWSNPVKIKRLLAVIMWMYFTFKHINDFITMVK